MLVASCGGEQVVSVLPARAPSELEAAPQVRVAVDATSAHLPLAVAGASIAYSDVDRAIARAVERALAPAATDLTRRSARKLGLSIELVEAHAESTQGRVLVRLTVRATLRENTGNVYLAQTHAHASASSALPAERGALVVLNCADSIAQQLAGWLAGIDLH
jgi:hypothetical protein